MASQPCEPHFQAWIDPAALVEARALQAWLWDQAVPRVLAQGFCHTTGLFAEAFAQDGASFEPGFRRVRVQARQLYGVSLASLRGIVGADTVAARAYHTLVRTAQRSDGGFVRMLAPEGAVCDPALDLYDNAFVLLALALYGLSSGDRGAFGVARSVLACIQSRLSHPSGQGYWSVEAAADKPNLCAQNPHMHLFEACLALAHASRDSLFLDEATRLFALAHTRLIAPDGRLAEQYDASWSLDPLVTSGQTWVEPGHQFEWCSLLYLYGDLTGSPMARDLGQRLFGAAQATGVDPATGLVVPQLAWDQARPALGFLQTCKPTSHRLWPQTEYLRAQVVVAAAARSHHPDLARAIADLRARFLTPAPLGLWVDRVSADGTPLPGPIPASSLYHLMTCAGDVLDHVLAPRPRVPTTPDVMGRSTARILVLGDVMWDRFSVGEVRRQSPEAPVPVLHVHEERAMLGGAANVAANVVALGGAVHLIGVLGPDAAGAKCQAALAALAPHLTSAVVVDPTRPTTEKHRLLAADRPLLRADVETAAALSPAVEAQVLAAIAAAFAPASPTRPTLVVVSDYAKGVCTPTVLQALIQAARRAGVPVFVDPKRADWAAYAGASLLKPNEAELAKVAGTSRAETGMGGAVPLAVAIPQALATIHQTHPGGALPHVLVTRGAQGMVLWQSSGMATIAAYHPPSHHGIDVAGAGDTVIATLALCVAEGMDLKTACHHASVAAGLAVHTQGTATITRTALARALADAPLADAPLADAPATTPPLGPAAQDMSLDVPAPLTSLAGLVDTVAAWRRQGLRVGFTNGCFDLLHPGHVDVIAKASRACDRLIVALNTDQSVRALKGPARPVQSLASRARVMAALSGVAAVVAFDSLTPEALIATLQPDVLIKGGDYTRAQVVGGDLVEALGGQVLLVDVVANQSTSQLIAQAQTGACAGIVPAHIYTPQPETVS